MERLKIYRGSDKNFLTRLKNTKTGDPYDLTNATLIQVTFEKSNRGKLILTSENVPATKAQATHGQVTFTAEIGGNTGNAIRLLFNGVDDVDAVVGAWNSANPTNRVSHNGVGTEVLSTASINLTGGYNAYQPVQIWGDPKYGKILVSMLEKETLSLRAGTSQSFSITIDNGDNPGGFRNIGIFEQGVDVFTV